jgi:transcriptional regulator with XRE-family HTH domain
MKHEAIYGVVGERIKMRRKKLGMTQEQLAQKLEISRASLANIETGRQSILLHNLYSIAKAIELAPESLLPTLTVHIENGASELIELPEDLKLEQKRQIERIIANVINNK